MNLGRTEPIILWNTPERWSLVRARSVAEGSKEQMANVLQMALQDIAALSDALNSEINPWIKERPRDAPLKF